MKHRFIITNEQDKEPFLHETQALVKYVLTCALDTMCIDFPSEISITFTDNEKIHKLNREFRNTDRPTDVLSFPQYERDDILSIKYEGKHVSLGDIVISLEMARKQALEFGHSYTREVAFLCVHSLLHLIGYDHMTEGEDKEMRVLQSLILERASIIR